MKRDRSPHGLRMALRPGGLRAAFRPIVREFHIWYLRWALREMPLTHPDLPEVVVRLRRLLDERYARRCYVRRTLEWL